MTSFNPLPCSASCFLLGACLLTLLFNPGLVEPSRSARSTCVCCPCIKSSFSLSLFVSHTQTTTARSHTRCRCFQCSHLSISGTWSSGIGCKVRALSFILLIPYLMWSVLRKRLLFQVRTVSIQCSPPSADAWSSTASSRRTSILVSQTPYAWRSKRHKSINRTLVIPSGLWDVDGKSRLCSFRCGLFSYTTIFPWSFW